MSPSDQRNAIADWLGETGPPQDYTGDLNAIHIAEAKLSREEQTEYVRWLWRLNQTGLTYDLIHATAAQRAEALLRTIGKWKD